MDRNFAAITVFQQNGVSAERRFSDTEFHESPPAPDAVIPHPHAGNCDQLASIRSVVGDLGSHDSNKAKEHMNLSISTTGLPRFFALVAAMLVSAALATPSFAQGTQQTGGTAQQQEGAIGGITPDQAFSSGVERTGVVGQSATAAPVGASAASNAGASTAGGGRNAFGGGFGGGFGAAFGNLFNNNNANSSNSTPPIRTRLRSRVELPAGVMQSRLPRQAVAENRFRTAGTLKPRTDASSGASFGTAANAYSGVNVQIQDQTAILNGTVANESDRRMSELLMRLEPGVAKVQNRISVSP